VIGSYLLAFKSGMAPSTRTFELLKKSNYNPQCTFHSQSGSSIFMVPWEVEYLHSCEKIRVSAVASTMIRMYVLESIDLDLVQLTGTN
jgi:hypothetical protein